MSYLGPGDVMLEPVTQTVHSNIKVNTVIDKKLGDKWLNTYINCKMAKLIGVFFGHLSHLGIRAILFIETMENKIYFLQNILIL